MTTSLYIKLSLVMGLEYAVWGAWMPVLAARLLGPLKFTGKQTGWIYATLPLACIVSPLIAGQLADKWLNAEWILVTAHLVGTVLLLVAATQTKFTPLFIAMFLYSLLYAATLPIVNAVLFANVSDVASQGKVFIWAPIAWALVGYFLTGWRWVFKTAEKGDAVACDLLRWAGEGLADLAAGVARQIEIEQEQSVFVRDLEDHVQNAFLGIVQLQ